MPVVLVQETFAKPAAAPVCKMWLVNLVAEFS